MPYPFGGLCPIKGHALTVRCLGRELVRFDLSACFHVTTDDDPPTRSPLLAAGVDIAVVSKQLGHSTVSLTVDAYSHLLDGVGRQAAARAMALVPRASRDQRRRRRGGPARRTSR